MKILIIYRHFWPDSPPYASMLRSISARLAAEGHDVTIWAEMPCYKLSDGSLSPSRREVIDGVNVERFRRLPFWSRSGLVRTLAKLAFVPRILVKTLTARAAGYDFDLVWTATIPPVLQGWCGRIVARLFGSQFLYHCQDLYPELAEHMGMITQEGALSRMARAIERRNRERADLLVTLSEDMRTTVTALAEPRRTVIINNFLLEDFGASKESEPAAHETAETNRPDLSFPVAVAGESSDEEALDIIFAGNMGQFQGLTEFLQGFIATATETPVRLTFMGDGKAAADLRQLAKDDPRVRFIPQLPFEEAKEIIAQYDFGLISLEPGIHRYAFPSKTLTYLGLGLPIIALVEEDSDLGRLVRDARVGMVIGKRDEPSIAAAIETLAQRSAVHSEERGRVLSLYSEAYSREARLDQWVAAIEQLGSAPLRSRAK
ncbi:hypothetical protein B5C34_04965 [Pacificimonas flava]|uniref:Glycosyltransferase subfamily 4-like N-terminal domain-containing protein n=2 Tax=Pacificimonas TaxID=1960290 RepID=A0A219B426_9SPHN|nr:MULTISPECIES: glycosyltransferase family 4 protein [Pacificimonas]MBZ6377432.1 glycosyltransferase family 4 protein [Pacificimonas aurantium]OWV32866.1 hypothetical protein B5C34_04965 [Pacificimonas flava]